MLRELVLQAGRVPGFDCEIETRNHDLYWRLVNRACAEMNAEKALPVYKPIRRWKGG